MLVHLMDANKGYLLTHLLTNLQYISECCYLCKVIQVTAVDAYHRQVVTCRLKALGCSLHLTIAFQILTQPPEQCPGMKRMTSSMTFKLSTTLKLNAHLIEFTATSTY